MRKLIPVVVAIVVGFGAGAAVSAGGADASSDAAQLRAVNTTLQKIKLATESTARTEQYAVKVLQAICRHGSEGGQTLDCSPDS